MKHQLYYPIRISLIIFWAVGFFHSSKAQVSSFPYFEDFESFSVASNATGFVNDWAADPAATSFEFRWNVHENETPSSDTGPLVDHTRGDNTGNYLFTEASDGSTFDSARVISPVFDFSSLTNPTVSFFIHMHGSNMGSMQLDVFDGTSWNNAIWQISGEQQTNQADAWMKQEVILTGYGGLNNVQIRFTGVRGSLFRSDMALDDVVVFDKKNVDLSIAQVNAPVANTPVGTNQPITYTIENIGVDLIDFTLTPITLQTFITAPNLSTDNPSTSITSGTLLPDASLVVTVSASYVFDQLGTYELAATLTLSGDENTANNDFNSNTLVEPVVAAFPYTEGFESGAADWRVINGSDVEATSWELGNPTNAVINAAATGDAAWVTSLEGSFIANELAYVESPFFDLSSVEQPYIQLDVISDLKFNGNASIERSTDYGLTWTTIGGNGTGSNWYNTNEGWAANFGWTRAEHNLEQDLPQYVKFRVAFAGETNVSEGFGFDNVRIGEQPENDLGITALNSMISIPQGNYEANVTITNFGHVAQNSFDLYYSIDGGTPVFVETITNTVEGNYQTLDHTFGTPINFPDTGTFDVAIWTDLASEERRDNDTITTQITVLRTISNYPYVANFESDTADWESGGLNNSFEWGIPNGSYITDVPSGTRAWVTNLSGSHNAVEQSYVESPFFNLSALAEPFLRIDYAYDIYPSNSSFPEVLAYIEMSADGESWSTLGTVGEGINWYNYSGFIDDGWTGQSDWKKGYFSLVNCVPETNGTLKFRVNFRSSAPLAALDGFAFTNFQILEASFLQDAGVLEVTSPKVIAAGQDYRPTIRLADLGIGEVAAEINSIDYQIDGGTVQSAGLSSKLVFELGDLDSSFTFVNPINITTPGTYELKIFIDQNAANVEPLSDTIVCNLKVVPYASITFGNPYQESFESGDGDWCAGGQNSSWEHGNPNGIALVEAAAGTNAWVTNLNGAMNDGEQSILYGPVFDLSATTLPTIRFDYFINTDFFESTFSSFYSHISYLEVSTDSGQSWSLLGSPAEDWYNVDGSKDGTPNGFSSWGGDTNLNWQAMHYDLSSYADQDWVQLRLVVVSESSVGDHDGFGLDNVIVKEAEADDVGVVDLISGDDTPEGDYVVEVDIQNFGLNAQTSFNVAYQLDGGAIVSELFNGGDGLPSTATASFTFGAKASLTPGTHTLTVFTQLGTDTDLTNDTFSVEIFAVPIISTLPYNEDFERSFTGWVTEGINNSWQLGKPDQANSYVGTPDGSANAWVTDTASFHNANESSFVLSPYFDFSMADELYWQFDLAFDTDPFDDGAVLQYSIDSGLTWMTIDTIGNSIGVKNWYNQTYIDAIASATGNGEGWAGTMDWNLSKANLPSALDNFNGLVRFRMAFHSNSFGQDYGVAFDNVKVAEIQNNDIGVVSFESDLYTNQGTDAVSVTIENFGFDPHSTVQVGYAIDGTFIDSEVFVFSASPLVQGAQNTVQFTADFSSADVGYHTLEIFTQLGIDGDLTNDTLSVQILVQPLITTFPYEESFEVDGGLWAADVTGLFEVGMPTGNRIDGAFHGDAAWVTNLDGEVITGGDSYAEVKDSYVISPEFDFSTLSNPFTYFYFKSEQNRTLTQLEYSLDSGKTWTVIGNAQSESNWYNYEFEDVTGWQLETDTWLRAFHPLRTLAGQSSVRLRFLFNGATFAFEEGFAFDLIKIGDAGNEDVGVHAIEEVLEAPQNVAIMPIVSVTNYGVNDVGNFDVTITADGQTGTVTSTGLQSSFNGTPYTESLSTNIVLPNTGTFELKAFTELAGDADADNDTLYTTISVIPTIDNYTYTESFEGTDGDWTVAFSDDYSFASWNRGVPSGTVINTASDGTEAWTVGADEENSSFGASYLLSPYFNFSNTDFPVLYFDMFLNGGITDIGEGDFTFSDVAYMEYTTDFGKTWNVLGAESPDWYNISSTNSLNENDFDVWANDESILGWQQMRQDLSAFGGMNAVRFRFVYYHSSSGGISLGRQVDISVVTPISGGEGFGIDHINVVNEDPRIVTNFNDSGSGSLRSAIEFANENPGADSIQFEVTGDTIFLQSVIQITDDSLTLDMDGLALVVKASDSFDDTEIFLISANQVRFNSFSLEVNETDHGILIDDGSDAITLTNLEVANADVAGISCNGGTPSTTHVLIDHCTIYNCGFAGIAACDHYTITNNSVGTDKTGTIAIGGQFYGIYLAGDSSLVQQNTISANDSIGLYLLGNANEVYGNYIGVDTTGRVALANGNIGIRINGNYNKIGEEDLDEVNVIAGNDTTQIEINGGMANVIDGNLIGVGKPMMDGRVTVLSGTNYGIALNNGAALDTITNNIIIGQTKGGIVLDGISTNQNIIFKNSITQNNDGFSGIKISNSAQQSVLPPEILAVDTLTGLISGFAAPNARVHAYADTLGEGALFLGDSVADASGNWVIDASEIDIDVTLYQTVTALQDSAGNTSEFSEPFVLLPTLVKHTGDEGIGSLPYVLAYTNTHEGADTVVFAPNLEGETFALNVSLPTLVDDSTIIIGDANQDCIPDIELDGTNIGGVGLSLTNKHSIIYGLALTNYATAIQLVDADSNSVVSNYIGVDLTGLTAKPNNLGIHVGTNSFYNIIGGDSVCWRNVIAGNSGDGIQVSGADSTFIVGNIIGLGSDGVTELGNNGDGVDIRANASYTAIGTSDNSARSVISANANHAIRVNDSYYTVILGNYLGTDITGTLDKGNGFSGTFAQNNARVIAIGDGSYEGRNIISGNRDNGIIIDGGLITSQVDSVSIVGNFIGLDATGIASMPNDKMGIRLETVETVQIGDGSMEGRNVISANGIDGIYVINNTNNIAIIGNYIGTDSTGQLDFGNAGDGVYFNNGSTNGVVGNGTAEGANRIAFNGEDGIAVIGSTTGAITLNRNEIYSNGQKGISLESGGNGDLLAPNIVAILPDTTVYGTAEPFAYIQLHADSLAQGRQYLGGVIADENGLWSVDISDSTLLAGVVNLTATQTLTDSTSEFSAPFDVSAISPNYVVITLADSVPGSLRAAIEYANMHVGEDTITFLGSIDGGTIFLLDDLAPLTDDSGGTVIDADVDKDCVPNIGIDATDATYGFQIQSANNVIKGLAITNAAQDGVFITSPAAVNNEVLCNYIGTDLSGTLAGSGNQANGIRITAGATNNTIGAATGGKNLISGNDGNGILIAGLGTENNKVLGNYIGTDVAGNNSLRNLGSGVYMTDGASTNAIGETSGGGNLISGNQAHGILIEGTLTTNNSVASNYIGSNAAGFGVVANDSAGIKMTNGSTNNLIGGLGGGRNLISGNNAHGVWITGAATSNNTLVSNYIGTDMTGLNSLSNDSSGVKIESGANANHIGNGTDADRNIISGNRNANILVQGSGSINNKILGNYVGVDANCAAGVFNGGEGIVLDTDVNRTAIGDGSQGGRNVIGGCASNGIVVRGPDNVIFGNRIGADTIDGNVFGNDMHGILLEENAQNDSIFGNVIANNGECGIKYDGINVFGNLHYSNNLFNNVACGISISNGAQQAIADPTINRVVPGGLVQGTAAPNAFVHMYGGPDDYQGKYLIDEVTADAAGHWEIVVDYGALPTDVLFFVAVQDSNANSSRYSEGVDYIDPLFVTNTNDDGIGSLRNAVNAAEDGDTIQFLLTYPTSITLTSGPLLVSSNDVVVAGPGVDSLTLSGDGSRIVEIAAATGVEIRGLTLTDGSETDESGGAISLIDGASLLLEYCRLENNTAEAVGMDAFGGALFMDEASSLIARFCSFSGNTADNGGGAIYALGSVIIENSTLDGNGSDVDGGAIYSSGSLSIINSTISGNAANGMGGGIFVTGGTANVASSTITNNTADANSSNSGDGGGIFFAGAAGDFTLFNTIIAGNHDLSVLTNDQHKDLSGNFQSNGAIMVGDDHGASLTFTGTRDQIGTTTNPINPQLEALADNGGFTLTHLPLPVSSAIDAGDPTSATEFDQRGEDFPRIVGLAIDIGAIEGIGGDTEVTSIHNLGPGTLWEAIAIANLQEGLDTVSFNIAGTGPHVIVLDSTALPAITDSLFINAYSQAGADTATSSSLASIQIEIQGSAKVGDLLVVEADGVTISGLALTNTDSCAILIDNVAGTKVEGNWIGVDATGNNGGDLGEGSIGVCIAGTDAQSNRIGGFSVGKRNIISGGWDDAVHISDTATNNLIVGNYIGLAPDGATQARNNVGVSLTNRASLNQIGGTGDSLNYISGNIAANIQAFDAIQNTIQGNRIGLNVNNEVVNPTTLRGVEIGGESTNQVIIDNVISGNSFGIYLNETPTGGTNSILRNLIGTDTLGTLARPNTQGMVITSSNASISANTIANSDFGILISAADVTGIAMLQNNYANLNALAVSLTGEATPLANDVDDLDTEPANLGQNYPEICALDAGNDSVLIEGTLNSEGGFDYLIELFVADTEVQGAAGTSLDTLRVRIPMGSTSVSFSHMLTGADSSKFFSAAATNVTTLNSSELGVPATVVKAQFTETVVFGDSVFFDFNGFGNIVQWQWDFENDGTDDFTSSSAIDPSFVYDHEGNHDVRLIVTPITGCPDTLIQTITSTTPFLNELDSTALAAVYTFDVEGNGGTTGIPWELDNRTFTWDGVEIRAGWATGLDLRGYEVAHLLQDTLVNLSNRQLDSLNIGDNQLDFSDLVTLVDGYNSPKLNYIPQQPITADRTFFTLVGQSFSIDEVPETHPNDAYQWTKSGGALVGETNRILTIAATTSADTGIYVCEVTNDLVPDLTLLSGEVTLALGRAMKLADSLALISLYNAVGGDGGPLADLWDGNAANWPGIVAEPDEQDSSRVVSIILNGLELNGEIPAELFELEFIRRIDFFNNNFSGTIPDNIGNATSLTYLDFDNNNLEGPVPASIGNLVNLKTLWLARNHLTAVPPEIGNLISLENLFMQENLMTVIPDEINNLDSLEVLNISDNDLKALSQVDGLIRLKDLRLSGNLITDFASVNGLTNSPLLKVLDLSENELDTLPELTVDALPNLQAVKVDLNRLDFADIGKLTYRDNEGYDVFYTPQKQQLPFIDTLVLQAGSITLTNSVELFPEATLDSHQFQWFKDNQAIPGATEPTFTINNMAVGDTGTYFCEVQSDSIPLLRVMGNSTRVGLDCSMTTIDVSISANSTTEICNGATVAAILSVDQDEPFAYQWYKNGEEITGSIGRNYAVDEVATYTVLVQDQDGCQAFSNEIVFTILPLPEVSVTALDEVTLKATVLTNATSQGVFQWFLNGARLTGETDSIHLAKAVGVYTASYTNDQGCVGFSTSSGVITALEEEWFSKSITIYPNPSDGKFHLQFANRITDDIQVKIFSASGVLVTELAQKGVQSITMDLSNKPSGIYYVEITVNGSRALKRLSKL